MHQETIGKKKNMCVQVECHFVTKNAWNVFLAFLLASRWYFWSCLFTSSADVMRKTREKWKRDEEPVICWGPWWGGWGGGGGGGGGHSDAHRLCRPTCYTSLPLMPRYQLPDICLVMLNLNQDVDYKFRNGAWYGSAGHIISCHATSMW